MPILFLRHAEAGDRSKWEAPDHLRPLSKEGWSQAEAFVGTLGTFPITRVLTSGYVRCVQSVLPLAAHLGLPVEDRAALEEGRGARPALDLMRELAGGTAVLCTHGDIMRHVLDALRSGAGLDLPHDYPCHKAGTWVLDGEAFPFRTARYLPPPIP